MQVGNIEKEEAPQEESLVWSIVKWLGVWLVVYTVVGLVGGLFRSSPHDIPAGMTWANAAESATSTFYILRGGPHLILELNPHSQKYWAILLTALAVLFMYLVGQALQGRLKDRQKELLPPWQQKFMAAVCAAMVVFILWYGTGQLFQKETLDLDPAADTVTLNGDYLSSFKDVSGFNAYETRGSKGSINYHITLDLAGESPLQIGGGNAHGDVESTAAYLNAYLVEVRRNPSGA